MVKQISNSMMEVLHEIFDTLLKCLSQQASNMGYQKFLLGNLDLAVPLMSKSDTTATDISYTKATTIIESAITEVETGSFQESPC